MGFLVSVFDRIAPIGFAALLTLGLSLSKVQSAGESPAATPNPGPASGGLSGAAFLDPRLDGVFHAPSDLPRNDPSDETGPPRTASEYWGRVRASIAARVRAPYKDGSRKLPTGRVVLKIELAADGSLVNVKVDASSGDAQLDEAAMDAVQEAVPFPERPAEVSSSTATLPISFAK